MDPAGIRKCMSLGYSSKKSNTTIGQCNFFLCKSRNCYDFMIYLTYFRILLVFSFVVFMTSNSRVFQMGMDLKQAPCDLELMQLFSLVRFVEGTSCSTSRTSNKILIVHFLFVVSFQLHLPFFIWLRHLFCLGNLYVQFEFNVLS